MEWLIIVIARLRALLRRDAVLEDIEEEMRLHIDLEVQINIERGMKPAEARLAALKSFGNLGRIRDLAYEVRGGGMLETLFQDLRYGARMLLKQPGFTLIAVLTLTLGIGANTAIFTLLDNVLIRALPVEHPEQLVVFVRDGTGAPGIFSYPAYAELRDRNDVLTGLAAYFQQPFSLSIGSQTERVIGQIVSGDYFSVLGVQPALGRAFLPEEDRTAGTHPVVVISHSLWQRRFDADPGVIGRQISLNAYSYTVVGVAPPEFKGTLRGTVNDVYVPMMMQVQAQPGRNSKLSDPGSGWLRLIGRLKPDVKREPAQSALSVLADESPRTDPGARNPATILLMAGSRGHTDRVSDLSLPLKLLMGVVGLVLLISCANVANLLLARASARRKEIAIRLAIGAGRVRVVRRELGIRLALGAGRRDLIKLVVGQGMMLSVVGSVIGIGASIALTRLIEKLLFGVSPTDPLTFAVIPLLLAGVTLVACWVPARRAAKVDPLVALRYE